MAVAEEEAFPRAWNTECAASSTMHSSVNISIPIVPFFGGESPGKT